MSHGQKKFEIFSFGFVVCETTPINVGNNFGFFFGVFVDAEKLVFIECMRLCVSFCLKRHFIQ